MKKIICLILAFCTLSTIVYADEPEGISCPSYILADGKTGQILVQKDADVQMPPASITKIMTMLLTMEAIQAGKLRFEDVITVSETAAHHEGSHVYLEVGEQITVSDLLKAVAVASGNDAAIALAEAVCGSEAAFVLKMNERAKQLDMKNTNFINCNGLDAEGHYSTAGDIAKMTFELSKHPKIFEYTSIWMDTLRDGKFQLANTNKLIRFYDGATGMKTGSTSKAGYCLSATAERNSVQLIAVVMHAETAKQRNADASKLLNYGFDMYENVPLTQKGKIMGEITVEQGIDKQINVVCKNDLQSTIPKNQKGSIQEKIQLPNKIIAPIHKGQKIGKVVYTTENRVVGECDIIALESVDKISFSYVFCCLMRNFLKV